MMASTWHYIKCSRKCNVHNSNEAYVHGLPLANEHIRMSRSASVQNLKRSTVSGQSRDDGSTLDTTLHQLQCKETLALKHAILFS